MIVRQKVNQTCAIIYKNLMQIKYAMGFRDHFTLQVLLFQKS